MIAKFWSLGGDILADSCTVEATWTYEDLWQQAAVLTPTLADRRVCVEVVVEHDGESFKIAKSSSSQRPLHAVIQSDFPAEAILTCTVVLRDECVDFAEKGFCSFGRTCRFNHIYS